MLILVCVLAFIILIFYIGYLVGGKKGATQLVEAQKLTAQSNQKLTQAQSLQEDLNRKELELSRKEGVIQQAERKSNLLDMTIKELPLLAEIIEDIEEKRNQLARDYLHYKRAPKAATIIAQMKTELKAYAGESFTAHSRQKTYEKLFGPIISNIQNLKMKDISLSVITEIQELSKLYLLLQHEQDALKQDKENYKLYRQKKYIEMNQKAKEINADLIKRYNEKITEAEQQKDALRAKQEALEEAYARNEKEREDKLQAVITQHASEHQQAITKLNILANQKRAELKAQQKTLEETYARNEKEREDRLQEIISRHTFKYRQELDTLTAKEHDIENRLEKAASLERLLSAKLSDIPSLAKISADIETARIQGFANYLRNKSHPSLRKADEIERSLKEDMRLLVQQFKECQYKCLVYENMYPYLTEYDDEIIAEVTDTNKNTEYAELEDNSKYYISKEDYAQLPTYEKYQLALDRYWNRNKTKAEIGRDYERFIGYMEEQDGWDVSFFGILKGLEDLGRDIICKKDSTVMIIQCKCWSTKKTIHEKHINQLFGTTVMYYLEEINPHGNMAEFYSLLKKRQIIPMFITSTVLSDTAQKFANSLGVVFKENVKLKKYPMIKCNVNRNTKEKIYHLPFDQQYDNIKLTGDDEFYAMTVLDAENAGFRRAMRHAYN